MVEQKCYSKINTFLSKSADLVYELYTIRNSVMRYELNCVKTMVTTMKAPTLFLMFSKNYAIFKKLVHEKFKSDTIKLT